MKKIVFLFSLFLITGIVAVNQANAQSVSMKDVIVDYSLFIPCGNNGMGENITGSLPMHVVLHFNKDGFMTKFHYQLQGGVFIGEQTGMVYHSTMVNQAMVKAEEPTDCNGAYTFTYIVHFRYVGKGVQFFAKGGHRTTVNANGDMTVDIDRWTIGCK